MHQQEWKDGHCLTSKAGWPVSLAPTAQSPVATGSSSVNAPASATTPFHGRTSFRASAKTNFSCVVGSEMYEDVDPGICTVGLLPDAHEMRVRTYAPNGEPADRPFHLAVFRD